MTLRNKRFALAILGLCISWETFAQTQPVVIGSKTFTESYLLAEMMAQLLESHGIAVERRTGLAGTLVAFQALEAGEIDVYPEYSDTLSQVILDLEGDVDEAALGAALAPQAIELLPRLGFNNTYAIAVTPETAAEYQLEKISDLSAHTQLRFGLSHEFQERSDGWLGLKRAYGLVQPSRPACRPRGGRPSRAPARSAG